MITNLNYNNYYRFNADRREGGWREVRTEQKNESTTTYEWKRETPLFMLTCVRILLLAKTFFGLRLLFSSSFDQRWGQEWDHAAQQIQRGSLALTKNVIFVRLHKGDLAHLGTMEGIAAAVDELRKRYLYVAEIKIILSPDSELPEKRALARDAYRRAQEAGLFTDTIPPLEFMEANPHKLDYEPVVLSEQRKNPDQGYFTIEIGRTGKQCLFEANSYWRCWGPLHTPRYGTLTSSAILRSEISTDSELLKDEQAAVDLERTLYRKEEELFKVNQTRLADAELSDKKASADLARAQTTFEAIQREQRAGIEVETTESAQNFARAKHIHDLTRREREAAQKDFHRIEQAIAEARKRYIPHHAVQRPISKNPTKSTVPELTARIQQMAQTLQAKETKN